MFGGKKISSSGQNTQKLFMTPAITSAVAPSARNFQSMQQDVNRSVSLRGMNNSQFGMPL